jgi:hypothetical protein
LYNSAVLFAFACILFVFNCGFNVFQESKEFD